MKDAVVYSKPVTLLPLTSKSLTFNSDQFPINNNSSVTIELHTAISSGLTCTAYIQGSLDGSTWFNLKSTEASITNDDDILWTFTAIDSLMYLRVRVVVASGSAIFNILYRGC